MNVRRGLRPAGDWGRPERPQERSAPHVCKPLLWPCSRTRGGSQNIQCNFPTQTLTFDVAPVALDDVDEVVYRGVLLEQQVGVVYPVLLPGDMENRFEDCFRLTPMLGVCVCGGRHMARSNATKDSPARGTWRMRQTIFSSRWVRVPIELTAIPPVFFFLKKMSGGLRFNLARVMQWGAQLSHY